MVHTFKKFLISDSFLINSEKKATEASNMAIKNRENSKRHFKLEGSSKWETNTCFNDSHPDQIWKCIKIHKNQSMLCISNISQTWAKICNNFEMRNLSSPGCIQWVKPGMQFRWNCVSNPYQRTYNRDTLPLSKIILQWECLVLPRK